MLGGRILIIVHFCRDLPKGNDDNEIMQKRLLIIRFSALGDVAMLVPLAEQLARTYPDWEITMLSRKQTAPLFVGMPDNISFVGADLKGRHAGINGLKQLLHDIDYQQFDAVADMHNVLRSRFLTTYMRLRGKRVATIQKGRWGKWKLTHTQHKRPLKSTVERYADVLRTLGFSIVVQPIMRNSFTERHGFGIAPFAAHKGKIYPLEKMEAVVRDIAKLGEPVYLFGAGEKEKAILNDWADKYPNVHSMVGQGTMDEEITKMRSLRVMLSMDSANMHLASLAGTYVVSIWGATSPLAGFLGYGQKAEDCIQRTDLPCRPCSIYGNKVCKYGDYRCLDIAPEQIVEQLKTYVCK